MIIEDLVLPGKLHYKGKSDDLSSFFNYHLDQLYCAKAHLAERLGEIEGMEDDSLLNEAITAAICCTDSQLGILERLYESIGRTYSFEHCEQVINSLDEYFNAILKETADRSLHALYFAAYLSFVRCIEETSLTILRLCAVQQKDKEMMQLLKTFAPGITGDGDLLHFAISHPLTVI